MLRGKGTTVKVRDFRLVIRVRIPVNFVDTSDCLKGVGQYSRHTKALSVKIVAPV